MAFRVYPEGQLAPLPVAAGVAVSATFDQEAAPDPALDPPYARVMHLWVAVSGTSAVPELRLRAGTGAPVTLQVGQVKSIFRGPAPVDYVGDAELRTGVAGVYRIVVGLDNPVVDSWELTVRNTDATRTALVTWVVAGTLAETAQPWLALPRLDLVALIGATASASVQVSNRGTGPCTIDAPPALPAGLTLTTAVPLTLAPTTSAPLTFAFTAPATPPPPDGTVTATATLSVTPPDTTAGTQPEHTTGLAVTASTQALDVVLLLDDSGSMGWDAAGTFLPAGAPTSRWRELASAANLFLDRLAHFCADRGTVGVARFPPGDPVDPASADVVVPVDIPKQADVGALTAKITAIAPAGGTPMGDGLERVAGPTGAFFRDDPVSIAADRRRLVLMSDGAHNQGVHNPQEYVGPPHGTAAPGASLADQRIGLFAVAYGIPGASDVDHGLLTRLASGSLGSPGIQSTQTGGVTATQLATTFTNMIKTGLSTVAAPTDPEAVFVFGGPPNRHPVLLTSYDTSAAFALYWNTPDARRLRLELITPAGEVITPENAGTFGSTVFRQDERHHAYYLGADVLRNDDDQGAPRYGRWTMVVGADPDGAAEGVEHYAYDVLTESDLLLDVGLDRDPVFTGDPVTVSARLIARGVPVTGATVVLSTTAPTAALANWLAGLDVPRRALAEAEERLKGTDSSPMLVKAFAARLAGLEFDPGRQRDDLLMTDADGSGVYRATTPRSRVPEQRTFLVTALGDTPDGVEFRREAVLERYVLVRPSRRDAVLSVHPTGRITADVVALPLDAAGNVLLLDPATTAALELAVSDARPTGPLTSNLDGSYTLPVRVAPEDRVTAVLRVDGVDVRTLSAVPFRELHYVDRVVDLEPGAIRSANQHGDPAAVLGDPVGHPDDRFLALGAGGAVTLGVEGRTMLAAPDDDDITVVVQPGGLRRSYRVEAFADDEQAWRVLGTSVGLTATFSLRRAGLDGTSAVRVVDTSGLARHPDLTAFDDPGARLRGVGVRLVG